MLKHSASSRESEDEPLEVAKIESNEANIRELVQEVKKRLTDVELPLRPKLDFDFISKFVRVKKYDVEKAVNAIKNYYEHIYKNLRRTEGMRPCDFVQVIESNVVVNSRNTFRGSHMVFSFVHKWDTQRFSFREFLSASTLMCEERMLNKEIQPHGVILIYLMTGLAFTHLKQLGFSDVKYSIELILHGFPMRLEGIHIVSPPRIYSTLHKLIMKFLPQKIRNRYHVHSSFDSLHTFIDKSILPHSLGGDLNEEEAIDAEFIEKVLTENKCYEEYWSSETNRMPRRMSRKRSSVHLLQYK